MPKIKWTEIDSIIHQCKNTLQLAHGVEMMCKKLRLEIGEQLDKINEVILEQVNGEDGK